MHRLHRYVASLTVGRTVLWCYLIWYGVVLGFYFDPAPALWLNSLGIAAVIGVALVLGVRAASSAPLLGWSTMRLFLTPFCVSSFSALIKGQGFYVIVPPRLHQFAACALACTVFVLLVALVKWRAAPQRRSRVH